jgi:hypothetical protein
MSLPFSPALASSPDPEDGRHYRVDEVSYPLRHSFSMAVGLPGAGRHEPTSCYDVVGSDGHYLCRIVAGVEETGDRRNFFIPDEDALDDSDDESGRFGRQLVARDGIMFEGCKRWRSGDWFCDYASRRPVSRKHYDSDGYVLKVFWAWQSHTRGQAGCALAINAFWAKGFWSAFAPALNSCSNGPMERP